MVSGTVVGATVGAGVAVGGTGVGVGALVGARVLVGNSVGVGGVSLLHARYKSDSQQAHQSNQCLLFK